MSEAEAASAPAPAPAPVSIRAKTWPPKRLSRKVLVLAAVAASAITAWAVYAGLNVQPRPAVREAEAQSASSEPPQTIAQASSDYDPAAMRAPEDTHWAASADAQTGARGQAQDAGADAAFASTNATASARGGAPAAPDPQQLARISPIFFSERSGGRQTNAAVHGQAAPADGARAGFIASQRGAQEDQLSSSLQPPRSRFEIEAGAVIPAALLTELNSDLPGRVIAQVTAPVYDSITGSQVLIPQGARLIGTYDSATTHGDNRILLAWNRIVFPNGWSLDLQGMDAADPSGASGLRDRVDNHVGPLAEAVGLASVFSVLANNSQNDANNHSLGQSVGDAAAQQAAQTGGRIVDRDLQVHPTLRVRPGAPVRVLVSRDIVLAPYRGR
jgi:type IV secretion system protein VirB10